MQDICYATLAKGVVGPRGRAVRITHRASPGRLVKGNEVEGASFHSSRSCPGGERGRRAFRIQDPQADFRVPEPQLLGTSTLACQDPTHSEPCGESQLRNEMASGDPVPKRKCSRSHPESMVWWHASVRAPLRRQRWGHEPRLHGGRRERHQGLSVLHMYTMACVYVAHTNIHACK